MNELEILIQAILSLKDTTKSKQQILSELPKLEQQLQSDKKAKVNIVAGLDISKSKSLIQSNLNTLTSQANVPTIKVGIDVGNFNNQSVARIITNDLKDVENTSRIVTDEMVKNFRDAFGLSSKLSKETKTELKSALQEVSNLWDTGSIAQYDNAIKRLFNFINNNSKQLVLPEIKEQIAQMRSLMSDGSKVFIDDKLRQELKYILGSAKEVQSVLSNVYGSGKWTFNKSKGGVPADTIINPDYYEKFQSMDEAILHVNDNLKQLQNTVKSTTFNEMSTQTSSDEIENKVKSILHLDNALQQVSSHSDVFLGNLDDFVPIWGEEEQINQEVQSVGKLNQELERTVGYRTQLSNKNYFSNDTGFLKDIQSFKEEEDAIKSLEGRFESLGATVESFERRGSNGSTNNFVLSVHSSTGELEEFSYKLENVNAKIKDADADWRYVLQDITASDKAVQRLAQSQAIFRDKLDASAIKLQSQLDNIKSSAYIGSKPIDFGANENLTQQYNTAIEAIEKLKTADKSTMASMQANASAEISKLQQMVKEVRNAEYAATQLRDKDIGTIKDIQLGNLDKFINQINNSKVPIEVLKQDVDNLKLSLSNVSDSKSLTEFLNQIDIAKSKFGAFKEFYSSVGKHNHEIEQMVSVWKKQGVYTDELKTKITALKSELSQVAATGNTAELTKWIDNYKTAMSGMNVNTEKQAQLNTYLDEQVRLTKSILTLQTQIVKLNPNKDSNRIAELNQILSARQQELSVLQHENSAITEMMSKAKQEVYIRKETAKEQELYNIAQKKSLDTEQRINESIKQKSIRLEAQIKNYETMNSKAARAYSNELSSIKNDLKIAGTPEEIEKIRGRFATLRSEIKAAGKEGQTFFQTLANGVKKFSYWMSLTSIISRGIRDIRKMVTTVIELDTALIDLKKTFKGTESDLKEFYYESNNVAKQLGVTTAEVIKQAAAWSRLGFSTKEQAIEMSKLSSMFASISPGMDVETATDGLLSVIKAFGYETNEVLDGIMSKINIVGNEFGTSNSEIVEMLTRSSSAMKEANNTLAETIALQTSAVEITRDAAGVGTAFKTLAMRLRGKIWLPPYKETYMLCA